MEGREYLAAHGVQEAVAAAVAEVLRTRPANPIQGIVDILHSRSGGASGTGASAASSSGGTRLPQSHDPRGLLDTSGVDVDPTAAMLAAGLGSGVLLRSLNLSGVRELNLKKAGLLALPPQIGELSQLTKLDVSLSPLSDLPEAIGKLSQLRILFCLGCRFGSVPLVLGVLPSLYMLSFKSNKLTSISAAALAPTLEWLILTDNQLTTLPSQLPKGLRKVMLTNNKLRQLPDALVGCADLELIRLADNALERLPAGMLTMPKLSWVGLAGNPLLARGGEGLAPLPAPRWVQPNELSFHEQLGAGGGGFVHRATWTCAPGATPVACAVKVFRGAASVTDGDPAHEIDLGEALSHPNVIRVLGACPAPQLGLVLELLEPGEWTELGLPPSFATCTRDTYKAGTAFSLAQVLTTLQGVAAACAHLHAKRFTHGDLYAHNTMVQPRTGEAKVGDFGAAYNYEPLGSSSAPLIERIEVRAFGRMAGPPWMSRQHACAHYGALPPHRCVPLGAWQRSWRRERAWWERVRCSARAPPPSWRSSSSSACGRTWRRARASRPSSRRSRTSDLRGAERVGNCGERMARVHSPPCKGRPRRREGSQTCARREGEAVPAGAVCGVGDRRC